MNIHTLFLLIGFAASTNVQAVESSTQKTFQLPQWTKSDNESYRFYVSNVSTSDISILIHLFDSVGRQYTESREPGQQILVASQFRSSPVDGAAILPAGNTGQITISRGGQTHWGTAKLTWSSDSCLTHAVQASVMYWTAGGSLSWRDINQGKPF
ncbi:hypothetical protein L1077_09620 [Pseudoalteromonas luteoviolacea]|uniref:hypothetical protein n=1 Tax=Pseudoalteromonas luteoviolacea TaxID=43657 RepID=UPI001F3B8135|nr:hypothetical protein [Pseudoalteromonas luteoviolacea]MCF6439687.1 hypothetical protein [Pseudoalteromonas luteoviolacea]